MSARDVTTQAELDQALAEKVHEINIKSKRYVELTVGETGISTVYADSGSTVNAGSGSTVYAGSGSTVYARSGSTVYAGTHAAVHILGTDVNVTGGVQIDHTAVDLADPATWCEYHGVTVVEGVATLYKAVDKDWRSPHGTSYEPGSTPSCDDWRDTDYCGNGLHFGPTPGHALAYHWTAKRFLAVGVLLSELRPLSGGTAKAKAPRAHRACVEVDVQGREVLS